MNTETNKAKIEDRKSRLFYADLLGVKTEYYNPNPCQEGNEDDEDRNDCIVRAICKVLNKSWRDVFEDMSKFGSSVGMLIDTNPFIELYLARHGYINISEIISENDDIITVGEFMYRYKTGRYIVSSVPHAAAYIDGVWYDNYTMLSAPNHYFLVDEHYGIYVNLHDTGFKLKIDERLKQLREASEKEGKDVKYDKMILEELNNYKIKYENLPKIGNIYKCNFCKSIDGRDLYYLMYGLNEDFGVYNILICSKQNTNSYNIYSRNGEQYYLISGYPLFVMPNLFNESNYSLVDSVSKDELQPLYDYLEKVSNRKDNKNE